MIQKINKIRLVLIIFISFVLYAHANNSDKLIKVNLRTVGHEFLIQLNDSTSRVLPIKKVNGRYAIHFERTFSFEPNLLFTTVFDVIKNNNIQETFIVEVEECGLNEVIHSFKTSIEKDGNIIPCKQRLLPNSCYVFYFTVIENKNEVMVNNSSTSFLNITYVFLFLLLVIIVATFLQKRRSNSKPNTEIITIGKYQFDKKRMLLSFEDQSTKLSNKESSLLFLLYSNENKTLEREFILNNVWGDEGNYIGRTLDVFVSKLRKKLEADSSLKIINVRGIGYRFVIT